MRLDLVTNLFAAPSLVEFTSQPLGLREWQVERSARTRKERCADRERGKRWVGVRRWVVVVVQRRRSTSLAGQRANARARIALALSSLPTRVVCPCRPHSAVLRPDIHVGIGNVQRFAHKATVEAKGE